MLEQKEGSHAVAEAVMRCRPEVVCAYPISPQTHIVEHLSDLVRTGDLAPCEYVSVESEFAARRLWLLLQRLRRFDRAWQRHVRRRSYGFLLPPPYRYGPPSDWKGHPA